MDYISAFDISRSGMALEMARLHAVSLNLANAHTTRTAEGGPYTPVRVVSSPAAFEAQLASAGAARGGVAAADLVPMQVQPRLAYQPGHPHADQRGYVAYPGIDPVSEMVTLMEAMRSYEANVRALNVAKSMAQRALEIGRER